MVYRATIAEKINSRLVEDVKPCKPLSKLAATIQPGGRIEILGTQLPVGEAVDVIVLFQEASDMGRRSVVDVLAEAPGHLAFQDVNAVDAYVQEERNAWNNA